MRLRNGVGQKYLINSEFVAFYTNNPKKHDEGFGIGGQIATVNYWWLGNTQPSLIFVITR